VLNIENICGLVGCAFFTIFCLFLATLLGFVGGFYSEDAVVLPDV